MNLYLVLFIVNVSSCIISLMGIVISININNKPLIIANFGVLIFNVIIANMNFYSYVISMAQ